MTKTENKFIHFDAKTRCVLCHGEWRLLNMTQLQKEFAEIQKTVKDNITLDGSDIVAMDSAGAWLLEQWVQVVSAHSVKVTMQGFSESAKQLMTLIEKHQRSDADIPEVKTLKGLARIGQYVCQQLSEFRDFLTFIGQLSIEGLSVILHPSRMRISALVSVIDKTGFQALPIISLLSFMIGVVIAYQMGVQLRSYGANIFIVDFLGLSILREFGPLLTAIMVAGRTGSAFTAQLGTMKINQEIDALNTMGVTPGELLLLPRVLGLLLVLPLLTIWADIFGVLGGMMMAKNMLDVSPYDFLMRFQHQIPLRSFIIGIGKAPVFAFLIASIGCFEGMRVKLNADSIGKQTTRSVVLSIFFIIVTDAVFSILFSWWKL